MFSYPDTYLIQKTKFTRNILSIVWGLIKYIKKSPVAANVWFFVWIILWIIDTLVNVSKFICALRVRVDKITQRGEEKIKLNVSIYQVYYLCHRCAIIWISQVILNTHLAQLRDSLRVLVHLKAHIYIQDLWNQKLLVHIY